MPSADSGNKACHYGMICWASKGTTAPHIPVRVANQDTECCTLPIPISWVPTWEQRRHMNRILRRFYWPGVKRAVEDYCRQCATCQKTSPKVIYHNPLVPLPIIETPFQRIAMDILGPLPKSSRGHQYILVILDYATLYPEAIPLRAVTVKTVARETFLLFSRVGIVEEILTDQGTSFMSKVLKELCKFLKVSQIHTSIYHPQTDRVGREV